MVVGGGTSVNADLERAVVERAYARWAPVYDMVCGPIFASARRAAVAAACRLGGRVLEVGVGTGLSFDDYDPRMRVVGIDLSDPMVEKARRRLAGGRYRHVEGVHVMDAHQLAFADAAFDGVVAQFVITLVADPERVLDECARVTRSGGEIILVNHLYSEQGVAAAIERWSAPHARNLGLRPEFPFARLENWARRNGGAELIERRRLPPFGAFSLVRFRRCSAAPQIGREHGTPSPQRVGGVGAVRPEF